MQMYDACACMYVYIYIYRLLGFDTKIYKGMGKCSSCYRKLNFVKNNGMREWKNEARR